MESKTVLFFNKLSFAILLLTVFFTLFFFIPFIPVTLETSKGFLVAIGMTLSLFFWLIARLGEGKFVFPKDKIIIWASFIPLSFLVSSFFSSSKYISLFGGGFEIGTFGSMLVLFILFFLSSIYFQSERRVWYFYKFLFFGGLILSIFELGNFFINYNRFSSTLFSGLSSGNLVGTWNDFGILFGIITLTTIFSLEFIKSKLLTRIMEYFLLISGVFFLVIDNIPFVWLLVGIFSIIIFVYSVSLQHGGVKIIQGEEKKRFPFVSLIMVFVALAFLVGNNSIGEFVKSRINLQNSSIRPSIVDTTEVMRKSLSTNPLFGSGPNTFNIDWALWQPKDVVNREYWNAEFSNGYSSFLTFGVTTGIVGLLAILLFLITFASRISKSLKVAFNNPTSNYFVMTTLMISIYSWIVLLVYTPNIIIMMLAFASSGILIGILVRNDSIAKKEVSFLTDPRSSFFSILVLMFLLILTLSTTYVYAEKFASIMYYSKAINGTNTLESLSKSQNMLRNALMLDKNDIYYRTLSQVYVGEINLLLNDKSISPEVVKSQVQQLVNRAEGSAQAAVAQNPKQYLNHLNLGNVYASLLSFGVDKSYEYALPAYNKAAERAPNNPTIILAKAQLEFLNKKNDEAKKYIEEALKLKLNYTDALFLLAQIETTEGNIPQAIVQAEKASTLAPQDATVFFRLGLLRMSNNENTGAINAFEQAVRLDPTYINARYFLAQAYQKNGRTEEARAQYNILHEVLPNNEDINSAIKSINQPQVVTPSPTPVVTPKTKTPTATPSIR